MAYDPVDGYTVLFGGYQDTPTYYGPWLNDTWSFAGGIWTNLSTPTAAAPPSKLGSEMVWDDSDGYILLVTTTNTTWSFVGGVWTQVVTGAGPGARYLPALAYDAADGYVVLFGGASLNSPIGQTWTYRAGVWTELNTSSSPWNRNSALFTYDVWDGYVLLFGGTGVVSGSQVSFNDTWTFLGGNWTLLTNANGPGVYRYFDVYGYDPLTSSVVAVMNPTYSSGNYMWEFAGGNWTQVTGVNQSYLLFDSGAFDPVDGEFVLVSGSSWFYWGAPDWISTYSLVNLTWAQVGRTPVVPALGYGGLVDDPAQGGLLLTDGQTMLRFENNTWVNGITQSTAGRCTSADLAYDASDGYVLLYCGQTWKFQAGNWTPMPQYPTDTWPPGVGTMSYDTADNCVLLYGPAGRNETWTWSAGNWTNVTDPAVGPPHRAGVSLADDPVDGYVVLFGGFLGSYYSAVLNDTWTFAAGKWTNVTTPVAPSARGDASMGFDEITGYVLLFGGYALQSYGPLDADTWSFSGGNWTDLTSTAGSPIQPTGRAGAALALDPASGRMLLLGGYANDLFPPSEWFWGPTSSAGGPVVSSFRTQPGVTDVNVSVTLRATVTGGALPYQYVYSGLPSGCASVSAPILYCAPTSAGLFRIALLVTDAGGNSSGSSLLLTVNARPTLGSFTIVPGVVQLGQTVGVDATFGGGTGPFSLAFTGLPPGCSPETVAVFSCVPSAPGNYSVRVTERDSFGQTATGTANLSVTPPPALGSFQISQFSVAPTEVTLGGTVVISTVTTGGVPPLVFVYVGLPAGCPSLDAAAFFCTPTQAGQSTIQVEASDSTPLHLFATALLLVDSMVGPPPPPPPPPSPPRIGSFLASPSEVTIGGTVAFRTNVTGGTPPYEFSYSGLPAGCASINTSSFSCVPTLSGQFAVGVTATDVRGSFAQAITPLSVASLPGTPGTSSPAPTGSTTLSVSILLVLVGVLAGLLVALVAIVLLRKRAP